MSDVCAPVLIIPGAFTDARAFEPVARPLRDAGYTVHVLDLPARSARVPQLHRGGLTAIDEALDAAIERAPEPPVLIGHSLGGLAALRASARHPLAALVLLMPAPPDGLAGPLVRSLLRDPLSVAKLAALGLSAGPVRRLPFGPPRGIYSAQSTSEIRTAGMVLRVSESWAVLLALAAGSRENVKPPGVPTLVVAGQQDHFIPIDGVRRLAGQLEADLHEHDVAHAFNEEPAGCHLVTTDVVRWLAAQPRRDS